MSAAESSHGAGTPAFGGSAAAEFDEAASVGYTNRFDTIFRRE